MTRKPLRTCLLLLALLLVTSSSAYADAISVTSVSVSNIQLVTSSGTIVFGTAPFGSRTIAHTVIADGSGDEVADDEQSPTRSEASTTTPHATANAVSDFTNFVVSANSSVMLSGCRCSAEAEGQSILRTTFTIVGGTGNVDVNFSALLQTAQNLMTDPFSLGAASDASLGLSVFTTDTLVASSTSLSTPDWLSGPTRRHHWHFNNNSRKYWPCNSISNTLSTYSFVPTHGQHKLRFRNRHQ